MKRHAILAEVDAVVFDGTHPNPTDNNVHDGLKLYQEKGCDLIISLGGGSSHDCGKGIGIVATNGGNIREYEGVDKSKKAMPPFIAVNTTAGTASVAAAWIQALCCVRSIKAMPRSAKRTLRSRPVKVSEPIRPYRPVEIVVWAVMSVAIV